MRNTAARRGSPISRGAEDAWPPFPLQPMLAVSAQTLPRETGPDAGTWGYEFKWDGIRMLAAWDGRRMRLVSRNGLDLTAQYPEISRADGLGRMLSDRRVILDGELIAPDAEGRPSFERLQRRMNLLPGRRPGRGGVRGGGAGGRGVAVAYMLFDLLWEADASLLDRPYIERRRRLDALGLEGAHWRTPPWERSRSDGGVGGEAMLTSAAQVGLEGIVAKRLRSGYEPGVRSRDWVKVKVRQQQDLVVVGWTQMRGRPGRLGSLLVGYRETGPAGRWRLAGQVGSGLSGEDEQMLMPVFRHFTRPETVVVDPLPVRREQVHHVEPVLVVEVSFLEWTAAGSLRHPVYRGVRVDKNASEVVRES